MPASLLIREHHLAASDRSSAQGLAFFLFGLLVLALVIGGCTMVGPDYVKPTAPEPQEWLESTDPKIESKAADFSTWWMGFGDPILNALVESAYQQNLSLQVTGIRILEARAQLGIAIGNQYPQTQQGVGDATAQKTSRNLPNAASAPKGLLMFTMSDSTRPGNLTSGASSGEPSRQVLPICKLRLPTMTTIWSS